ncbi:hypothetical protein SADUNF_Sadunf14G0003900 [Salix dunnii]|uniref:Uncharacterized protein n=1 Tax=Salix dunnii TaxID=1413687 RepID=A0A835JFG2_9ROSI|nr:hypothetical protein SADUNF_Sadunf14G0003900 [Salix dunnii]
MALISPKSLPQVPPPTCLSSAKYGQFLPVTTTAFSPRRTPPTLITTRSAKKPSRLIMGASASSFSADIGDVLSDVSIFTSAGEPVMFKDLWDQNEGIAVVALLRHFGCPCWNIDHLAAIKHLAGDIFLTKDRKLFKASSVAIFPKVGDAYFSVPLYHLPFPMDCLYADPERKAYDVLGLYYGLGRTFFNPASAKVFSRFDALRNAVKNYTIEATPDDRSGVLQQACLVQSRVMYSLRSSSISEIKHPSMILKGGMFVFKGKQLLYSRKDEGTGDHAPLDDIFEICCKVPVA